MVSITTSIYGDVHIRRRRKQWVPRVTDLGSLGTPADGTETVFNAPADWVLSLINGTVGNAYSTSGGVSEVFEYVTKIPTNPNAAYFYVAYSPVFPSGYKAYFSSPPAGTVANPSAVVYSYSNYVTV